MKNFLLILIFCICNFKMLFAQCTPVDCYASLPVYGGICDTVLATGVVNTPYMDSESFVITDFCFDAGLIDPTQAGTIVKISNVDNFTYSGLPLGINATTDMLAYMPPSNGYIVGCIAASGTPTEIGEFAATADFLADIRAFVVGGCGGFSVGVNDNAVSYSLQLIILPNPSFTGLNATYCELDAPVNLTVTGTTGGTFSGPGVIGTTFDPAAAGPGTHMVKYLVARQEGAAIAPAADSMIVSVTVNASTTYYADTDADSFGDVASPNTVCGAAPMGFVADNTDCNDNNSSIFPGATEICDGIDNNCDGNADEGLTFITYYLDNDNDTFGDAATSVTNCSGAPTGYVTSNTDCDDTNNAIFPGATEICDGIDNNCDGNIDEGLTLVTYYLDNDNDTYGDAATSVTNCSGAPANYVTNNTDCDDTNSAISPGATEICDGIDNNCDGNIDEGLTLVTYYLDNDNDTYGDAGVSVTNCSGAPTGYVTTNTDCNDNNNAIFPGATEICDGIDNNCDGNIDEGLTFITYYQDTDGDNFGNSTVSVTNCTGAPVGYVTDGTDCDDTSNSIFPGANEVCDGVDNNCDGNIDEGLTFITYYLDNDNDNFGDATNSVTNCSGAPAGYVTNNTDCDDTNSAIFPGAAEVCDGVDNNCDGNIDEGLTFITYYLDNDSDNYGDAAISATTCSGAPTGFVADNTDCDDNNSAINPGALEIPANMIDENCDGVDGIIDNDMDLFDSTVDCNDSDNTVYPGALELCDGQDNNCDGSIDEGLALFNYFLDADNDNYGDAANMVTTCALVPPTGYVVDNTDCNDNNSAINGGVTEICDGIDNNCDGNVDEGLMLITYYFDNDNDGAGNPATSTTTCSVTPPTGYVANSNDCNDNNSSINPGASETCDGIDNNCDGNIDEGLTLVTYYQDSDNDGSGNPAASIMSCVLLAPTGYVTNSNDCDDTNSSINPGAAEICDGVDNNCDGNIDEALSPNTYYLDSDNDNYGDAAISVTNCNVTPPTGYVPNSGDCDDNNSSINPGATEICDGIDNNCDGNTDEGLTLITYYLDSDNDGSGDATNSITSCVTSPPTGFVANGMDCDDTNSSINPSAIEACDGIDNNCDGNVDEGLTLITYYLDTDGDGYGETANTVTTCSVSPPMGYAASGNDCNDNNSSINPGATEICDGIDNNCDGNIDENLTQNIYYLDMDNDNFGDQNNSINTCDASAPSGYVANSMDCNDSNPAINPSATEVCDGIDNNCDGSTDEGLTQNTYYIDTDNDGYGDANTSTMTCSATAPTGYVANGSDCDDSDSSLNPGITEICDGIDNNCDGNIDEGLNITTYYEDGDNDGYGDATNSISSCEMTAPTGYSNLDTDCDDTDADINPAAVEIPNNGIDEDCDGGDLISSNIDLQEVFGLNLYPNPATAALHVAGDLTKDMLLEVFDIQGKKIFEYKIQSINPEFELDVSNFGPGVYILKITDKDLNVGTAKFNVIK